MLTLGIAIGSWWAYYELGWGGWWLPVENASLMPWLAATALLHSAIVVEKRGQLKSWTVLLAIWHFHYRLLAPLLWVGIVNIGHGFASDPARGVFVLGILLFAVGIPLTLYAWRGPQLVTRADFTLASREGGLIANNMLLVVATAIVLLGTFTRWGWNLSLGPASPWARLVQRNFQSGHGPVNGVDGSWTVAGLAAGQHPTPAAGTDRRWYGCCGQLVAVFVLGRVTIGAASAVMLIAWLGPESLAISGRRSNRAPTRGSLPACGVFRQIRPACGWPILASLFS